MSVRSKVQKSTSQLDANQTSGTSPTRRGLRIEAAVAVETYLDVTRKNGTVLRIFLDAADYPLVAAHHWHVRRSQEDKTFYAQTHIRKPDGTRTTVSMHQLIVRDAPMVDHKDGNGLNHRRSNLRVATNTQNQHNRGKQVNGTTSGFIGVDYNK